MERCRERDGLRKSERVNVQLCVKTGTAAGYCLFVCVWGGMSSAGLKKNTLSDFCTHTHRREIKGNLAVILRGARGLTLFPGNG